MKSKQQIIDEMWRVHHEITMYFNDIAHWNSCVRKPDEEEIEADPDGTMEKMRQSLDIALSQLDDRSACEGCGKRSTTHDSEGIPLCAECAKECGGD
jgi:hypothetical protein